MRQPPIIECLHQELEGVLFKYEGQGLSIAEVIGTLEVIKHNLFMSQHDTTD